MERWSFGAPEIARRWWKRTASDPCGVNLLIVENELDTTRVFGYWLLKTTH